MSKVRRFFHYGVFLISIIVCLIGFGLIFGFTIADSRPQTAEPVFPIIDPPLRPGGGLWSEQGLPTAFDGAVGDNFGESVAISGDTAIIGAPDDDNARGTDAGAVYIFTRSGTVWTMQQKLTASDGTESDSFGFSVSISGETVVVGAHHGLVGDAYVFTRSGTVWTEQQKLTPSDGAGTDEFGSSVSISGDTVVVGSRRDDNAGGSDAGSAYVFTRTGTVWTQQQKLTASDGAALDFFGFSASISGDTVIIGAYVDDHAGGLNAGSAYVFTRSGTVWTQQQKLTASDATSNDLFGNSVSISGDSVVVGAYQAGVLIEGAAYVFTRSGTVWTQQQKLTASDGADSDSFGGGVSISGDTVVIGAFGDNTAAGSAYVFSRSGIVWTEQQKLTASDRAADDNFGNSVSISGDTLIVGSYLNDTAAGADAGSAYIFKNDPVPTPTNTSTPTATATNTPTPAETPSIGGTVTYGNSNAGTKFISNAAVNGAGSPNVFTTTAAPGGTAGQYLLTGFGAGSYTVSLSKTTGQNSITSNDAARIAQHVSGSNLLNTTQKVVADVSNNGVVSSFDAGQIATFVASGSSPGIAGQWRFFVPPGPTFPVGASPTSRTYPSVTSNITGDDYVGLLIGEVTGNWTPSAARPAGRVDSGQWIVDSENVRITAELPQMTASLNKEIVVPVNVQGIANKGVISYEFDLRYDASVMQPMVDPVDVKDTASRGLSVVTNATEPGLLRVVVYGAFPIDENGVLLNLRFTAVGAPGSVSPLTFERIMFNEGEPRVSVANGNVELF